MAINRPKLTDEPSLKEHLRNKALCENKHKEVKVNEEKPKEIKRREH